MAGNIKGITIEIQGNVTPLEQALKTVNNVAKNTATEMKQIDKALKFNPSSIELITQKQEILTKQIGNTEEKLKTLKNAQKEVEEQFKAGQIGEEQYRAFKRELETTESTLTHYKTQLTNLNKEQENLGKSTNRLSGFFKASGKDVEEFRHVLGDKLTDAIKNGKASSKDMEKALELMAKEASEGKADINELKEALDKLDDGGSINNVKEKLTGVGTAAKDSVEKTNQLLGQEKLQKAAEVASQAGQKVIDFAHQTQDAFREVDAGMDIIVTKTGITGEQELASLKSIYDQLSTDLPVDSFEKVGSAIGELNTQFGYTDEELKEASRTMIQFSEINGADITTSTINAKRAMEVYNLEASQLTPTLDQVTFVAQATGQSVDLLFQKATEGAPQIKELGLSFSEGATLIGQLEKAGVDSSATLTAMTKATAKYAKEGKTLSQGLSETIEKIKNADNSTTAFTEAAEVFGNKGAAKMIDAIKRGAFSLDGLSETAEKANGTVANTFEATLDPIDRQQQAMNAMKLAMAEFGGAISAAIAPILEVLIPIIQQLAEMFKNLPAPVQQFIVVLGGVVAVLGLLLPAILAIQFAFTATGAAMLPIVGTVAAVAAGIALAIAVFMNFGSIIEWLDGVFPGLKDTVDSVWNSIQSVIDTVVNAVSGLIQNVFGIVVTWWEENQSRMQQASENVWNAISNVIQTVMNFLSPFMEGTWNVILTVITTIWQVIQTNIEVSIKAILGIIQAILQILTGDWQGAWETIKNVLATVLDGMASNVKTIFDGILTVISGIWENIKSITSSVWDGIKSSIGNAINSAKDMVGNAIEAIKGFFNFEFRWPHIPLPHFSISGSANPLDWLSGGLPSIGIEWYAKGGILTKPTVFGQNGNNLMVGGEAGTEAVLPLNSKNLAAIGKGVAEHMESDKPVVVNVHISDVIVREESDIQKIANAVANMLAYELKRKKELRGEPV